MSNPSGKHGGTSVGSAGAGDYGEFSRESDGGEGGALVGSGDMVGVGASFRNLLSETPRHTEESLKIILPGNFFKRISSVHFCFLLTSFPLYLYTCICLSI